LKPSIIVSRIKKIYFIYSKRLGNRKRLTLCNAYIIPNSKYRQIFVQHYCDSLVTIVLYKRSLKKHHLVLGLSGSLKSNVWKKTDNQQQLTSTKKKSWEEYLEKTKYSQSCIYIEISALLVRLIVNIMEEIEKKNLSNISGMPFEKAMFSYCKTKEKSKKSNHYHTIRWTQCQCNTISSSSVVMTKNQMNFEQFTI